MHLDRLATLNPLTPLPPTRDLPEASTPLVKVRRIGEDADERFTDAQMLCLHRVVKFVSDDWSWDTLLELAKIPRRPIEYLLTTYSTEVAPDQCRLLQLKPNGDADLFIIRDRYSQLMHDYQKSQADICCRGGEKIELVRGLRSITTNLRQMNMFMWLIREGVAEFIFEHYQKIRESLTQQGTATTTRTKEMTTTARRHRSSLLDGRPVRHIYRAVPDPPRERQRVVFPSSA